MHEGQRAAVYPAARNGQALGGLRPRQCLGRNRLDPSLASNGNPSMANRETQTITGQHPLPVGPCTVVIFGASGDLTRRKLVPALYNLARQHLLPDSFAIVGVATSELGTAAFRERLGRE